MKIKAAKQLIERELKDLDIPKSSRAYALILDQALAASEYMGKQELIKYIEEYVECLPLSALEGS